MTGKKGINVLVYEKDPEGLKFLKGFFRKRKGLKPLFLDSADELHEKLETATPDALIIGFPDGTKELQVKELNIPTVALISGNIPEGLKGVIQ